jgi:two-component system, chemotaxis family, protein-glutamate methylesterase/glutaminase
MAAARLVVIGASAGGLPVLQETLRELSADFPAIICVVVHIPAWRRNLLPALLRLDGRHAIEPVNHQPLRPGRVYVAPPDHHLIIDDGEALVWHGPKENSHRPAINALFRSAAITHGPDVVGIVLSGALEDGATGLWWIKRHGGIAIVQDPKDAQFPSMPQSALATVDVDYCVAARDLPALLAQLVGNDRGAAEPSEAENPHA